MENMIYRTLKIITCGVISAILLFLISLYFCYFAKDMQSTNLFASYGLKAVVVSVYIGVADLLARHIINKRKQ